MRAFLSAPPLRQKQCWLTRMSGIEGIVLLIVVLLREKRPLLLQLHHHIARKKTDAVEQLSQVEQRVQMQNLYIHLQCWRQSEICHKMSRKVEVRRSGGCIVPINQGQVPSVRKLQQHRRVNSRGFDYIPFRILASSRSANCRLTRIFYQITVAVDRKY